MEGISKLDWFILDSLSNSLESVTEIWKYVKTDFHYLSEHLLKDTLYNLYQRKLIYIDKVSKTELIDREDIMAEEIDNEYSLGKYYFGLAPAGVEFWEEASKEYYKPVDWSSSHVTYLYPGEQDGCRGIIEGVSKEVCLNEILKWDKQGHISYTKWKVNMNSLVHSDIEGFRPKYCKYISGGHRISFKLNRQ